MGPLHIIPTLTLGNFEWFEGLAIRMTLSGHGDTWASEHVSLGNGKAPAVPPADPRVKPPKAQALQLKEAGVSALSFNRSMASLCRIASLYPHLSVGLHMGGHVS